MCPLIDTSKDMEKQEEQRIRIMSIEDLEYFEKELIDIIIEFVRSIVSPVKGVINNEIFNYYIDFSSPSFVDEYEEEEEKNPDKLY